MAAYINKRGKLVVEFDSNNKEMAVADHYSGIRAIIDLLMVQPDSHDKDRITYDALVLLQHMIPDEAMMLQAFK